MVSSTSRSSAGGIGDTLSSDGDLEFGGIPRFSPEHFARISVPDPLRRKHLDEGLRQLSEGDAAQVFYSEEGGGSSAPIVGAVGKLQFDVLLHRLEHEYGVKARLENLSYRYARWVTGRHAEIRRLASGPGRTQVYDAKGAPLILFESEWNMRTVLEREKDLAFHDVAP